MDLKEWDKAGKYKYIIHLIDAFTRYSQLVFIDKKCPKLVLEKIMTVWTSVFGTPRRIWSDNGGEFSNEGMKDLWDNLVIEVKTGAA